MTAQLQIDQAGLPAGTPGVSRTDGLRTGAVVTLTNTGIGATTLFRLLDVPLGDITAVPSLAATVDPKVWEFTPTEDAPGTYLIELIEDQDQPTEKRERRIFGVRTALHGLLIPGLNEIADPNASLILDGVAQMEASDDNSVDYSSNTDLNDRSYAGWWRKIYELFMAVAEPSQGWNAQVGTTYTIATADAYKDGVSFNNAAAITVTVPNDAADDIPIDSQIPVYAAGAGQVTFSPQSPATIESADSNLKLRVKGSPGLLWKRGANDWVLTGDLTT